MNQKGGVKTEVEDSLTTTLLFNMESVCQSLLSWQLLHIIYIYKCFDKN